MSIEIAVLPVLKSSRFSWLPTDAEAVPYEPLSLVDISKELKPLQYDPS
jgi:hypothetical protein